MKSKDIAKLHARESLERVTDILARATMQRHEDAIAAKEMRRIADNSEYRLGVASALYEVAPLLTGEQLAKVEAKLLPKEEGTE